MHLFFAQQIMQKKQERARETMKGDLESMQALDRDQLELPQSKLLTASSSSTPRVTPRLSLKFGKVCFFPG